MGDVVIRGQAPEAEPAEPADLPDPDVDGPVGPSGTPAFSDRVLIVFGTQVITAGIGTLVSFFLARALGPSGKGDLYFLTLLPTTVMVLLQLGLNQAFGYASGRGKTNGLTTASVALSGVLGISASLVLLALLPALGMHFAGDVPPTAVLLSVFAVPLVLNATFSYAIVIGRQAVVASAVINIAATTVNVVLLIILVAILQFGVLGGVVAFFVAQVVQTVGFAIESARVTAARNGAGRMSVGALFRYGLPFYPASITSFFSARADVYLLAALLAEPSAPIGFYSMAVSIAELVFYLPNAVSLIFFPHVAGSSREDADQQAPLVSRVTLLMTGAVALALVPVAFTLIPLLIPAFVPALPAMLILLPGVVALSVTKVLTGYATGLGRTGLVSIVTIGAFVLNIAINLVLIPAFGILGASTASLISYSASSIALSVVLGRMAGVRPTAFWIPRRSDVRYVLQILADLARRVPFLAKRFG